MGWPVGDTDLVGLGIDPFIKMHKGFGPFRKSAHHGHAHTVKAAGHFVGFFIKLAPGVEPGHYQLQGADFLCRVDVHGNTPAVILHPDNIVPFQNNKDIVTEAHHGFVDRVINNFKYQMMEAVYARGTYVHAGTLAYRFQTFKNRDILRRIVGIHWFIL